MERNCQIRNAHLPEFRMVAAAILHFEKLLPLFAYPKGTSLCQDALFEPSTINIGLGVRPVDVHMKKGTQGMEG